MGVWQVRGRGIDEKEKRTLEHGQQCGDCWWGDSIRGLKGSGKIQ